MRERYESYEEASNAGLDYVELVEETTIRALNDAIDGYNIMWGTVKDEVGDLSAVFVQPEERRFFDGFFYGYRKGRSDATFGART